MDLGQRRHAVNVHVSRSFALVFLEITVDGHLYFGAAVLERCPHTKRDTGLVPVTRAGAVPFAAVRQVACAAIIDGTQLVPGRQVQTLLDLHEGHVRFPAAAYMSQHINRQLARHPDPDGHRLLFGRPDRVGKYGPAGLMVVEIQAVGTHGEPSLRRSLVRSAQFNSAVVNSISVTITFLDKHLGDIDPFGDVEELYPDSVLTVTELVSGGILDSEQRFHLSVSKIRTRNIHGIRVLVETALTGLTGSLYRDHRRQVYGLGCKQFGIGGAGHKLSLRGVEGQPPG